MKQITILLLLTFGMRGQNAFNDDLSKHYFASINIVNIAASSTTYFQYEICKNVRLSVSLAVGLTAGVAATNFKEDVYDSRLNKGTPSNIDREFGILGACVGTLSYIPGHNKWFVKKMDLEKFVFDEPRLDNTFVYLRP